MAFAVAFTIIIAGGIAASIGLLIGQDISLGDRTNMVYKGTLVTGGQGIAAVVGTGQFTELGNIQKLVGEASATNTPLSRQLDQVGSQLVLLSGGICSRPLRKWL